MDRESLLKENLHNHKKGGHREVVVDKRFNCIKTVTHNLLKSLRQECAIPENIHTRKVTGNSLGSQNHERLKLCMKLNWNFQWGGGGVSSLKNTLV